MRKTFGEWLVVAIFALVILGAIWAWLDYEYNVWGECLKDHPWWYCWRILS